MMKQNAVESPSLPATKQEIPGSRTLLRWVPSVFFVVAAVLLVVSIRYPYWGMHLSAPQYEYRGGLDLHLFVNVMTGEDPKFDEMREINGLNHYIGMRSLDEAALVERAIAIPAIAVFAIFLGIVALWRRRWIWVLAIPALTFPFVFLADLAYWLNDFGQNLDPAAPFSSSIPPFTPPLLGAGSIGQFESEAFIDLGWLLAFVAAVIVAVGLLMRYFEFRQEKKLQEQVQGEATANA